MNANALLIAELVQELQDMTKRNEQAVITLERYQDDAEHWKNLYRAVVNKNNAEA